MHSILTQEQLNKQKAEARDAEVRQNLKSHCTKIRDGIKKNDSTSSIRAIWELFQNASDLALNGYTEIKITLTNDEFIFAHKGKAFTYDTLCSLVKQVSSHDKEDDIKVGQYGTGFLSTHTFGRYITVIGSMQISENPKVYVDVEDFIINRENFDNIPLFIEDMKNQILAVDELMNNEQKSEAREWTELRYRFCDESGNDLREQRIKITQTAIDEAIKLMPYVMTFNDNIGCCQIADQTRKWTVAFSKSDKVCNTPNLRCKTIVKKTNSCISDNIDCYYLELHGGESRIILPLRTETEVCALGDIPRFFVHFPLIGQNDFHVDFLFHSHRFTPKEKRDDIIVPRNNETTELSAKGNIAVLNEMTTMLWRFLEQHVHSWSNTIDMATIRIKTSGFDDDKTEQFYMDLKKQWSNELASLKLIDVDGLRYSFNDEQHPIVLEPKLESFITDKAEMDYLSVIYPYAKNSALIPEKEELLRWSKVVAEWDASKSERFLSLETIVNQVSKDKGDRLHDVLKMIVEAGAHEDFFEKYALIPNREGVLRKRNDLRDAQPIVKELYELVKAINPTICEKMVDESFADIVNLTDYTRMDLRNELNSFVESKEKQYWDNPLKPQPYDIGFEKSLIAMCSAFSTNNGDSKRNRLMPIICKFEGIEYMNQYIPQWKDEPTSFDLYRELFKSLVENQMKKIELRDAEWVEKNLENLILFVEDARGDDFKKFCTQYAIYPDMNGCLHKPENLKRNNGVNELLFDLYQEVMKDDLRSKCVDARFEEFFPKYSEADFQYTPQKVAREIQDVLEKDEFKDTKVIDIIDLTEMDGTEGEQWRRLFGIIYDKRESIRYNLGSKDERKAINRMLKKKNPEMMKKLAEVSERSDANVVLSALDATIENIEHNTYIKMLGDYAESHIKRFLEDALTPIEVNVKNEQGGQDFILSKKGYKDYYIEVKSRWESELSVEMSISQFERAVDNPERYALISMNMYHFDREKAEKGVRVELAEIQDNIKVLDNIGMLEKDLKERAADAFRGGKDEIRLDGSYSVRVPQNVFDLYPLNFAQFIGNLTSYFQTYEKGSEGQVH